MKPIQLALLVGVAKFKAFQPLNGCDHDVENMRQLLRQQYAFKEDELMILVNEQATYSAILDRFEAVLERVPSGSNARVIVYFSTHGRQTKDLSGDEALDETIVTFNSELDGTNDILDDQVWDFTNRLAKKTTNITLVYDLCHSGDAAKGLGAAKSPTGSAKIGTTSNRVDRFKNSPPKESDNDSDSRSYTLISACRSNQQARVDLMDGQWNSVFTYHFCKYLRDTHFVGQTPANLIDEVKYRVKQDSPYQTPRVEGPNADTLLFGLQPFERTKYIPAQYQNETLTIQAGQIHGMTKSSQFEMFLPGSASEPLGKSLGLAKLTKINSTTSHATTPAAIDVPQSALRAVERIHVFEEDPLKILVLLENDSQFLPNQIRELIDQDVTTKGQFKFVENGTSDFVLSVNQRSLTLFLPGGVAHNNVIEKIDLDADWQKTLAESLFRWGRWKRIKSLQNDSVLNRQVEFDVRPVAPVETEESIDTSFAVLDGHDVKFQIKNRSDSELYFCVLNLVDNSKVGLVYPKFNQEASVRASESWPKEQGKTATTKLKGNRLTGDEVLLLLVSKTPFDFRPMLQHGQKCVVGDPLSRLLERNGLNSKDTTIVDDSPNSWAAFHCAYTIVKEAR